MQFINDSGYRGPVGILDHRNEMDAEESLKQNLVGLRSVRQKLSRAASTTNKSTERQP